ncbi:hypothetical protein [Lachnotalea glycerini]|uniref:Uncharacterized protein n=1 Tax=Lachnotalea glycerini TaxID=1763509 RepID=A0A371JBG7_9FIRM|nr:hypothetical protein [Lachnotalea glycerini]RDY30018.1 hypothetical protein CG710_016930 [Lachnotalea glycerini]
MKIYVVPTLIATDTLKSQRETLRPSVSIGEGIVAGIGAGVGSAIVDKAIGAVIIADAVPGPANPG